MGLLLAAGFLPPHWPELKTTGGVVAAAGGLLAVWASRTMGRNLTPFPRPRRGGELVDRGPYRFARHPIYGGGLLFFVGFALAFSIAALVPTATLAALWLAKSRDEERRLVERFPGYAEYRRRVRGRFLPLL